MIDKTCSKCRLSSSNFFKGQNYCKPCQSLYKKSKYIPVQPLQIKNQTCQQCLKEKPIDDFFENKRNKNKHEKICKECFIINKPKVSTGGKICTSCQEQVNLSEFCPDKRRPDGLGNSCKTCRFIIKKTPKADRQVCICCQVIKSAKLFLINTKTSSLLNPICIPCTNRQAWPTSKICKECNVEKKLIEFKTSKGFKYERSNICKPCCSTLRKSPEYLANERIFYYKNKDKINKKKRERYKIRYNQDAKYRLKKVVSTAIRIALKNNNSQKYGNSILKFLPYTLEELKINLENKFEPWMNWENWGPANLTKDTWQIDHIIPQSLLPYSSMNDDNFKKCWALSNLRPLKAIDNLKKQNKLENLC